MKSFDNLKEVNDYFTNLGFHEYAPSDIDHEGIITCYQKRYTDDIGKRYFLNVRVWDFTFTDKIPENFHPELWVQLYKVGSHDAFNLEFIDWEIDQVEELIDEMFEIGLIEHYEEWD